MQRDTQVELTYAEVAHRVDAAAGQFAAAGVGRGDVVAVMLPNRVELLLALLAAWRLGGVDGRGGVPADGADVRRGGVGDSVRVLPVSLRVLAMRELFRIPLFGPALRAIGTIEVDRESPDFGEIDTEAARAWRPGGAGRTWDAAASRG